MNVLQEKSRLTRLAQSHLGFEPFNYDFAVDWATELLRKGVISENIQMLASFSTPTDSWEIKPYVQKVLREFNLEEYLEEDAIQNLVYHHVDCILNEENVMFHLKQLCQLCIDFDYEDSIYPFYLLKFSWDDLEELGTSYHNHEVTFQNFHEILLKEAKGWMKNFKNKYK